MYKNIFLLILTCSLAGCYSVNQNKFNKYATDLVLENMVLTEAVEKLKSEDFLCDYSSLAPAITCTRDRQSVLPYTCIERINLSKSQDGKTVALVEVPKVVCAGL